MLLVLIRIFLNTSKGFTLIELLVSMVIMAVLAGMGMLAFGSISDSKALEKSVEQVRSAIYQAREEAYFGKKPKTNCSRLDGTEVQIINSTALNPARIQVRVLCDNRVNSTILRTINLDNNISLTISNSPIFFNGIERSTNLIQDAVITITRNDKTFSLGVKPNGVVYDR